MTTKKPSEQSHKTRRAQAAKSSDKQKIKERLEIATASSIGRRKFRPVREIYQDLYGYTPTNTSITRWKNQGLKTARVANRLCSTDEYVIAFVEGGERIEPPKFEKPLSVAAQAKADAKTEKELAAEGIGI